MKMEWKQIPSKPGYEVSEFGDVRRTKTGRILKPWLKDGYARYTFYVGSGRNVHKMGYQLVAEAFLEPKPFPKAELCHTDGNRANHHWTNLRWDTRAGNNSDKYRHGTMPMGERHHNAKLSDDKVRSIRIAYADGNITLRELAHIYGVWPGNIYNIIIRKTWRHLA